MTTFINLTGEAVNLLIGSNIFSLPTGLLSMPTGPYGWTLSLTNGSSVVVPVSAQSAYAVVNVHLQGSSIFVDVAERMGEPAAFLYGFGVAAVVCLTVMGVRQLKNLETVTADL